ncbi:MAG TPA: TonB family protein [Cyclobacteriaceae bacterium]|nr:TonB family protein [Cyclobacteriaceae bacterium]
MKTRPEISDHEIHSMMDFDKVLNEHRSAKRKGNIRWIAGFLVVGIAALMSFYFLKKDEPVKIIESKPAPALSETDNTAKEEIIETPSPKPVVKETPKKVETPVSPPPTSYVEAEPLNGYPELYAYFQKQLRYPIEALKDSIEGIVSVSFVINKDGKPEQIKILDSLGTPFDNEAIRVIEGMAAWKPASMNGKPVPARISMPLTFQINRKP